MKKIVIISVYFGKAPSNYNLLLKSIEANPDVDFLFFTDQDLKSNIPNLKYVSMSISRLNDIIHKKIGPQYNIKVPYKCCDYKPVYGILFEEYIKGYDFWGYCDIDLIFGDIRKFVTDDMLEKYDKILSLGHLSFYRNTKEVNNRYKEKGSTMGDYNEVFSRQRPFIFDEQNGIGGIYRANKYPFFEERIFADISNLRRRFVLAANDKNYKHQIFYWEKGHVYRAFEENGKIGREEFIYIHFKKRKYLVDYTGNGDIESFYICDKGFIWKEVGLPTLDDMKKYNRYHGKLYEFLEKRRNVLRYKIKKGFRLLNDKFFGA